MPTPTKFHPASADTTPCPETVPAPALAETAAHATANSSKKEPEPPSRTPHQKKPPKGKPAETSATADKPRLPAGKPRLPAGKLDRASIRATSRPRPITKRPGGASIPEPEPCLAGPPEAEGKKKKIAGGKKKPVHIVLEPEEAEKPKASKPKKPVRLADALLAKGVTVHEIADGYAVAYRKLKAKEVSSLKGSVAKTFIDTLEKVKNIVEPIRPASDRAPDAPAIVKLIHRVPRPQRRAGQRLPSPSVDEELQGSA